MVGGELVPSRCSISILSSTFSLISARPQAPQGTHKHQLLVGFPSTPRARLPSLVLTLFSFHNSLENLLEALGLSPMKGTGAPAHRGEQFWGQAVP